MQNQMRTTSWRAARLALWVLASLTWFTSVAYAAPGDPPRVPAAQSAAETPIYLLPNFHDACMGWLVSYAEERNFGLYSYLAHLDRVAADPQYRFVMSEIPHLITMMEFEPQRMAELKQRIAEGRVELVNAFVLEPTVSLSGGEALVQQGVQGLQWYQQILGQRPRAAWMIDLCGWHEQMAQITRQLGLDAFVYCRFNPTGPVPPGQPPLTNWDEVKAGAALHWITSPDGSRVLAVSPGLYCDVEFQPLFRSEQAVGDDELRKLIQVAEANRPRFPAGVPPVIFGGEWDYSMPFRYHGYPSELTAAWDRLAPQAPLRVTTFGAYLDTVLPTIRATDMALPTAMTSSKYGWSAFWVNAPKVKQRYRRTEHLLQTAEALATIGSLAGSANYPSQEFANSWFLMAMNMDRNVLWGAGVDESFADPHSWDTMDRFAYVEAKAADAVAQAMQGLAHPELGSVTLFNPVNWTRRAPFELQLPRGQSLAGVTSQLLDEGGTLLVSMPLGSTALTSAKLAPASPLPISTSELPATIVTSHYEAKFDRATGALVQLLLKSAGHEMLGGPANVVLAEAKSDVHSMPEKAKRTLLASSSEFQPTFQVTAGPLATVVDIRSRFHGGGELRRVARFYHDSPRIDFVTETNDVPPGTILSVEFPLADAITEVRRGIPYGFSHGAWSAKNPQLTGITSGIVPAIRYTDYALQRGGGVAILDRGLPGRELVGNTPILLLHNVCDAYALTWKIHDQEFNKPSAWMNAQGKQVFEYALIAHEEDWSSASVPQMAWEYNSPVVVAPGWAVTPVESSCETSPNVIVEALRRMGDEIELRLVECLGQAGKASVRVNLPHTQASQTDVLGGRRQVLTGQSIYDLELRPQQIVTIRLRTLQTAPPTEALRSFEPLIPAAKRAFMRNAKNSKLVGHPPSR